MEPAISEYSGLFNSIDIRFANFIAKISKNNDPDILLGAALVSNVTGGGDVCLNLALFAGRELTETYKAESAQKIPLIAYPEIICPEISEWRKKLFSISAVGRPGDYCPLIIDADRLYLYRYWEYEKKLADSIQKRVSQQLCSKICLNIESEFLKQTLKRLFPEKEERTDWQRLALLNVLFNNFTVITGGPGTGKTTVVTKIITILLTLAKGKKLKILMAAPTGKAAARLSESITDFKEKIDCPAHIRDAIPTDTFTIHRMLGTISHSPYFRHNSDNPLSADIVIIDEASMVDLPLMSKLVQAVPEEARLVLVGDKDQLASVESGAVLGDICNRGNLGSFSDKFANRIKKITGENINDTLDLQHISSSYSIRDSIVDLKKNYRFSGKSGIEELSRYVNKGDAEGAFSVLKKGNGVKWRAIDTGENLQNNLKELVLEGFSGFLKTDDPDEAIAKLNAFKILSPVKKGPFGVFFLNEIVEQILSGEDLIKTEHSPADQWYRGRPVLITRNDYNLKLFNGDIGIIMHADVVNRNELYAFFPDPSGGVRRFLPWLLPDHETVFAMTVHKSQGSEFDNVIMILPEKDNPILTRELIYTGITRARENLTIWGREAVLKAAISRRIERASGLREAFWDV
ncbi:MAG: exodeoxyribonuclease V subunit alpha [Deltaproteobacteria bacterium]|nr:exodeoxyribonuclease V subunit alpha [Deltaproteobacteria bacterium]